ncbi:hypothetical protein SynA1840_01990 [Synechococcus sp. A18-40]|nr:hypothetical protein SynA1840_01990 [Synechococcus sp. A18-40]
MRAASDSVLFCTDLNEIHRNGTGREPFPRAILELTLRTSMRRLLMSTTLALALPLALWPLKLIYRQPAAKP